MASEKTTAIVLRVTEFSETSCIAVLFTREYGKHTLIAKGARRPKSPFEAALDLLAVCRIVFLHKSSSAMGILTEAKLERRFRNRRMELPWLYGAFHVIELLRSLMEENDPHPEIFDLAIDTISRLDQASEFELNAANKNAVGDLTATEKLDELNDCLLRFEVGLLKYLGHFPLLSHCVGCGRERKTNNMVLFGVNAGGLICPKCHLGHGKMLQVRSEAIDKLIELGKEFEPVELERRLTPLNELTARQLISPNEEVHEEFARYKVINRGATTGTLTEQTELRMLMNRYLTELMGQDLRSLRFVGHWFPTNGWN